MATSFTDIMSSLMRLDEDRERYEDVYLNGFSKIAMKDVVLKKVSQYFDDNVMQRLTEAFSQDGQFNLLGVGVGEGQHELHFLQSLGSHLTSISNVAVDINEKLLATFKGNAAAWNSDDRHDFHWFNGPLSQFFDESPLARSKYNLICAIHSMYHTGDLETTLIRLASMLKEKGLMIIVLGDCSLLKQTILQNTWLPASHHVNVNEKSYPERISTVAQKKGYTVTMLDLDIQLDLTELFDDKSELGDRLTDFMSMVAYFRKTAPTGKLEELMSFWRSFCSEDKDGRMRTDSGEKLYIISTIPQ